VKTLLIALAFLVLGAPAARAQVAVPKLEARVTDLTGTLTASQQSTLEDKLQQFEARKGSQVVVLIVPTTQPEDIAQFGIRVAEAWKIGRQNVDDGAILIIAKEDRTLRIEVGRGLEGPLPDITAGRIINDTIVPLFRQGDFYGGVNAGVDRMIRVIDGEPLPAADQRWQNKPRAVPWPFILIGFLAFGGAFRFLGGRAVSALIAGFCAGIVIHWLFSRIVPSVGAGAGVFLFSLLMQSAGGGGPGGGGGGGGSSRRSRVFRDRGGWGGGFGGGGFGGGGGGFGGGFGGGGGFSGGGGGFGGGGASGRW